ncbi:MAG: carbohydrate ABC transporter permease [Oscillospiraceae bacterium]
MQKAIKKKSTLIKDTPADKIFMVLVYLFLTLSLLVVLLPLLHVIAASFSDPGAVIAGEVFIWPVRPTLRGYEAVFKNPKIISGFANSFFYMIVGTAVNIAMTLLCAYPLSRREFRARNVLSGLIVFTMYFSGGLVPTYMVVNKLGLIDTRAVMIIPVALSVWNVIICRTFMSSTIPDALYEAASLDGCTPIGFLWRIVIPLSGPIIAVLVLYYGVGHWNTYFNAMIYLKSNNLMPLQIVLREILVLNKIDPAMMADVDAMLAKQGLTDLLKYSVIVVASVPVMLIYPFVQKYFVQGVMIGAIKG